MKILNDDTYQRPIKSWCDNLEDGALKQAEDLARHPKLFSHVALLADCHQGYGMPIGGVIACDDVVIPNAVGVDIGCGMGVVKTNIPAADMTKGLLRIISNELKELVPVGLGQCHSEIQTWGISNYFIEEFEEYGWYEEKVVKLANRNLGTLGGGNHFMEIQEGDDGLVYLMIHSGSRNLGYVIAKYYNDLAVSIRDPELKDLAYLNADSEGGKDYIHCMNFALAYAEENRKRIMNSFKYAFALHHENMYIGKVHFENEINIHHNYASLERHFGKNVWVHRKGATSAKNGEYGIIPGSMGTSSYIVKGFGNKQSFKSCSHGAGRVLGRMAASRTLTKSDCDKAMEGILFDRWNKLKGKKKKNGMYDLGEAPQAYKDIDEVILAQSDLINPIVKLKPLAVVKG